MLYSLLAVVWRKIQFHKESTRLSPQLQSRELPLVSNRSRWAYEVTKLHAAVANCGDTNSSIYYPITNVPTPEIVWPCWNVHAFRSSRNDLLLHDDIAIRNGVARHYTKQVRLLQFFRCRVVRSSCNFNPQMNPTAESTTRTCVDCVYKSGIYHRDRVLPPWSCRTMT